MNYRMLAASGLWLALSACSNGTPPEATASASNAGSGVASTSSTVPTALASCPSQDFDSFLGAFVDDVQVQKAFVNEPLENAAVDANAEPEPKLVTNMLHASELHFPLMPGTQQQARDGLKQTIKVVSANEREVSLVRPDTDYQLSFRFRHEGCWKLYRIQDDSL